MSPPTGDRFPDLPDALDVQAGPLLFIQRPDLVWGLIAALYIGNVMLLILNLPMVGLFVRILYTPMYLLLPLIMMVSVVGVYSANQAVLDLVFLCGFGVIGYFMRSNGFPIAPVILGFVLGGRMEVALRQSMIMTQGYLLRIVEWPIVAVFLGLALFAMVAPIIMSCIRFRGQRVVLEQDES